MGQKGMEGSYQSVMGLAEFLQHPRAVSEIGEKEYFKRIQTSYGG